MSPRPRNNWTPTVALGLCALVLVVVVAGGADVSASAVRGDAHGHDCRCGPRCRGASCCCTPRKAPAKAARSEGDAPTPRGDATPCVGAAPCDAPGLPNAQTAVPDGKAAATALGAHVAPDGAGKPLPNEPPCILPARRADRVDEPPERAGVA